jgi:hypothetical protein
VISPDVVEMGVSVVNAHREGGDLRDDCSNIRVPHAGIDQESFLIANDEIGDDLFRVFEFGDPPDRRGEGLHGKP